jgi:YceI-like domain
LSPRNLTIHGVTRPLSIPARFAVSADLVTLDAAFQINQSDFGMDEPRVGKPGSHTSLPLLPSVQNLSATGTLGGESILRPPIP